MPGKENNMKLKIEIVMDNDAFAECNGTEAARILREIAERFDGEQLRRHDLRPLRDVNGNRVGEAKIV
jgi:hypothetical protein